MGQHAPRASGRDSNGFGTVLQLPFVLHWDETLVDNEVEAVSVSEQAAVDAH